MKAFVSDRIAASVLGMDRALVKSGFSVAQFAKRANCSVG
jgi:hypothetical protein